MKTQNKDAFDGTKTEAKNFHMIAAESRRVAKVAHNAGEIISDLDRQFASATKLNGTDIAFLFFAAALQCVRWLLMPEMDFNFAKTPQNERWTAAEGGEIEKVQQDFYTLKNKRENEIITDSKRFFTWEELILSPVPYDAMNGTADVVIPGVTELGKNLSGKNHHAATFGHDPIIGWVVGPLNIISRTITFTNMDSRYVALTPGTNIQTVTAHCPLPNMLSDCYNSVAEDSKRLFAAVAKQGMHQASDKYTKYGLQIPFVSPDRAQELLRKGWNSAEVEKIFGKTIKNLAVIGAQAGLSILINQIIKALHLLCYDGCESLSLYEVRTRKILSYSNVIASSGNILYAVLTGQYNKLDIGGMLVTIYRLLTDYSFIQRIKQEFLEKEWYNIVVGDEYDF